MGLVRLLACVAGLWGCRPYFPRVVGTAAKSGASAFGGAASAAVPALLPLPSPLPTPGPARAAQRVRSSACGRCWSAPQGCTLRPAAVKPEPQDGGLRAEAASRQEGAKLAAPSSNLTLLDLGEICGFSRHRVPAAGMHLLQKVRRGSSVRHWSACALGWPLEVHRPARTLPGVHGVWGQWAAPAQRLDRQRHSDPRNGAGVEAAIEERGLQVARGTPGQPRFP